MGFIPHLCLKIFWKVSIFSYFFGCMISAYIFSLILLLITSELSFIFLFFPVLFFAPLSLTPLSLYLSLSTFPASYMLQVFLDRFLVTSSHNNQIIYFSAILCISCLHRNFQISANQIRPKFIHLSILLFNSLAFYHFHRGNDH